MMQESRYSSRIIKAGALLSDSKLLLENWNGEESADTNLDRIRRDNLLGKPSRSRVDDVLAAFKQRYLRDPDMLRALTTFSRNGAPSETLDRLLYFQAARSDLLLHDLVADLLYEWAARTDRRVRVGEVSEWLAEKVEAGVAGRPWSEAVRRRVVRGLLSALRDFGILEGSANKQLAFPYLSPEAFAFVAFRLHLEGCSGNALPESAEWRLFLLPEGMAERMFLEAHQERLLEYHAAGSVVRVDFPAESLEEYANFVSRR